MQAFDALAVAARHALRPLIVLIAVTVFAAISSANGSPRTTPRHTEYTIEASPERGAQSPYATASLADTICVYSEDFSGGAAGWTPVNRTGQIETYWHVAEEHSGMFLDAFGMVCSTADSSYGSTYPSCYDQWEGYGSSWIQRVRKSYTLPPAPVTMSFTLAHSLEWESDFILAQLRASPADTFAVLAEYTGSSSIEPEVLDLSAWAEETIEFEFLLRSDDSGDDSDRLYDSGGIPVWIDDIEISGHPREDFLDLAGETMEGWIAVGAPATPGGYRLVESPECFPGFAGCDTTSTGESYDPCNAWVAYDSLTGEFPYRVPDAEGLLSLQSIAIESPVIPLPADGTGYYLECDIYYDVPAGVHAFVSVEWSFDGGLNWEGNLFVRLGDQGWEHYSRDITTSVLNWFGCESPTNFIFRLGAVELPYWYEFTGPTPGPYFKNPSIKVSGTATPEVPCAPSCGVATGFISRPPHTFQPLQNQPNPFNPTTRITFSLTEAGPVRLTVYDVSGRFVKSLVNRDMEATQHAVDWDGTDSFGHRVASGVYFYRITTTLFNSTRKMVILK